MVLLGHEVIERFAKKRPIVEVLDELKAVVFLRVEDAEKLNREAFVKTHIWEEIYTDKRTSFK